MQVAYALDVHVAKGSDFPVPTVLASLLQMTHNMAHDRKFVLDLPAMAVAQGKSGAAPRLHLGNTLRVMTADKTLLSDLCREIEATGLSDIVTPQPVTQIPEMLTHIRPVKNRSLGACERRYMRRHAGEGYSAEDRSAREQKNAAVAATPFLMMESRSRATRFKLHVMPCAPRKVESPNSYGL